MTRSISHRRFQPPLRLMAFAAGLLLTAAAGAQTQFPTWSASEAPAELRPAISRADIEKETEIRGWLCVEMPKRTQ